MTGFPPPPPPPPPNMSPPPGYVAYGGFDGPTGPTKPIGGITKALVILQGIGFAAAALLLVLQIALVGKSDEFITGQIDSNRFDDAIAPFLVASVLVGLIAIAGAVLAIVWSFRIAGNLTNLNRQITWKPGLTIVVWLLGGCTLSIINFLMLREHWQASEPGASQSGWRNTPVNPLIIGWFVLMIAQIVLAVASGIQSINGFNFGTNSFDVAESLTDRLPFVVAAGLAQLAAAVLLIMIIRQLSARHMAATGEA